MSQLPYNKFDNHVESNMSHNPNEHQRAMNPDRHVIQIQKCDQLQVLVPEQRWSWGTMALSVFSLFCCPIFGLIATMNSITSYVDHKVKDYAGAQRKRNLARGFAIAAIVIGCIFIIIVIISVPVSINTAVTAIMNDVQLGVQQNQQDDSIKWMNDFNYDQNDFNDGQQDFNDGLNDFNERQNDYNDGLNDFNNGLNNMTNAGEHDWFDDSNETPH